MGSQRLKEDEVRKISTLVFVTNFPDQFTAKELWNTCKQYGYVVDAFIPNRRSKAVGRHKIHANVARFQRVSMNNSSSQFKKNKEKRNHTHDVSIDKGTKGPVNSYVHAVKGPQSMNMGMESNPVLVLDESCVNQQVYAYCLPGKVKEFASLTNLKVVLVSEGFDNVKLRYMGGFWVMLEFSSKEVKMKFQSSIVHVDDQEERCFHGKRVCINTTGYFNILESFKIIYQGKAYWVRAKEVLGWVPDFVEENDEVDESDDESFEGEPNGYNLNNGDYVRGDSEIDEVPDTIFEEKLPNTNGVESFVKNKEMRSEDPFNIYDLVKTKKIDNKKGSKDADSLKYPPGFTPRDDIEDGEVQSIKRNVPVDERDEGTHNIHEEVEASGAKKSDSKKNSKGDGMESICSGHFKNSETPHSGGSILLLMDELVKNFPKKDDVGLFVPCVANWKGEVIIIGDFNEFRNKAERFGSVFNVQGANAFNMFISSAGLEEVPFGGCSFTWCHKSATKMSKLDRFLISESLMSSCPNISAITLDRFLSDHRPILLRESKYDYGPIPFRFFHYWFEVDGFVKLVEETWNEAQGYTSNAILNLMKKLKFLKKKIPELDAIIDKGDGNDVVIQKRTNVVESILKVEKLQSMEAAQKAKIKWAIEGDENSKYYHGILNKKRNQLTIRGVLVEGNWIETPALVKSEFLFHFKSRFQQPQQARLNITMDFPRNLSSTQQADLEIEVTNEEIKRAVWDCGVDKSPRPDGFTFAFYRCFWKLIKNDVVDAVKLFFHNGFLPKGSNSSFIALIPKTPDANMVKDFRPISLIGSFYKIISKILANRLVVVLGDIVNEVQSAFVADRQILDGPFTLNELFQWCKSKKKQYMIFKVDFEKDFNSVRWDYLDDVLKNLVLEKSGAVGFKVAFNLHGSKLMGISVDEEKVDQAASKIGCVALKAPFSYLGSKAGGIMSRIRSWNEIVDSMIVRLSKWKMKTLSIGGRLTLLKVIKAIHGDDGKIGKSSKAAFLSIWLDIVHEIEIFKKQGIDVYSFIHKKLGNRKDTAFWKGTHISLDYSFRRDPRGCVEQAQFIDLGTKVADISLVNMRDRWTWDLEGSGDFSVASVRKLIDDKRLPDVSSKTRWIKAIPIKINVHAWKVRLDCLPTRINISRRGIDIESILCPICDNAVESSRV
ncbi:RNA-directed DNA polymerase, eukaryota [Tanacetum coccineum]